MANPSERPHGPPGIENAIAVRDQLLAGVSVLGRWVWSKEGVITIVVGVLIAVGVSATYAHDYLLASFASGIAILYVVVRICVAHRRHEKRAGIIFVTIFCGAAIFCLFLGLYYRQSHLSPELHGLLIPANNVGPKNTCLEMVPETERNNFVSLYAGSSVLMTRHKLTIIKVRDQETLSIAKHDAGISVSTRILAPNNQEIVIGQITDNELWVNPGHEFYSERPDWHNLIVRDHSGHEVFYLYYLNPHTVIVRGVFYGGQSPIVIGTDAVQYGSARITHNCYIAEGNGIVRVD
jgi:hypothetical protein